MGEATRTIEQAASLLRKLRHTTAYKKQVDKVVAHVNAVTSAERLGEEDSETAWRERRVFFSPGDFFSAPDLSQVETIAGMYKSNEGSNVVVAPHGRFSPLFDVVFRKDERIVVKTCFLSYSRDAKLLFQDLTGSVGVRASAKVA